MFYTLFCNAAKKCNVVLLGLCQMPDHIHAIVQAKSKTQLSAFVRRYSSEFAREFNFSTGHIGAVFEHNFGYAVKFGAKKIRTALAYLYNNPVERKLSQKAEEYRWNYLAYSGNNRPFSESYVLASSSRPFRNAVKIVEGIFKRGAYLRCATLDHLFDTLNSIEKNQLVDKIVSLWSAVDYDLLISFFGSYSNVITAFASNTGSEYDIAETFEAQSDQVYNKMSALLVREGWVKRPREVINTDTDRKFELLSRLQKTFNATPRQYAKFLHLKLNLT